MSDELLTRRQILAIFGAGTGTAIVGSTQANLDSDTQGNLYGGTANMAELYQVGPGLWKGPLSVRSDVPKEDGHDFIQTDAGPDGNLYAMHHYNGGWDKQGLSTTSLDTEDTGITEDLSLPLTSFNPSIRQHYFPMAKWNWKPATGISGPLYGPDVAGEQGLADPFARDLPDGSVFAMAETIDSNGDGAIAYATGPSRKSLPTSTDSWDIILDERPDHLAYPYPINVGGQWYLTPHNADREFRIYDFSLPNPSPSVVETPPQPDEVMADPTPRYIPWIDKWVMFYGKDSYSEVRMLLADESGRELVGHSWSHHPDDTKLPTQASDDTEGVCGTPIVEQNRVLIPIQGASNRDVRWFEITNLTETGMSVNELENSPTLAPHGKGWAEGNMHHHDVSARQGESLVDGRNSAGEWSVSVYEPTPEPVNSTTVTFESNQTITDWGTGGWQHLSGLDFEINDVLQDWDYSNAKYIAPVDGYYDLDLVFRLKNWGSNASVPYRAGFQLVEEGSGNNMVEEYQGQSILDVSDKFELHVPRLELTGGNTYRPQFTHFAGDSLDIAFQNNQSRFGIELVERI